MPGSELIGQEELQQLTDVINNKTFFRYNQGYKVKEFEDKCKQFLEVPYALAVNNGTSAVAVALKSCGIRAGDEVIIPAFTFVATQEAIESIGAVPVIVDIDESLNIDPEKIKLAFSSKTKAIITVHMLGSPANMDAIMSLHDQYGIMIIEDACQSFGGKYKGMKLGSIGNASAFSFAFTKSITCGEGGLVATHSKMVYDKATYYHDHGHEHLSGYRGLDNRNMHGFNYRMSELNGAVGLAQLSRIDYILSKQFENKDKIKKELSDCNFKYRSHHDPDGETHDTLVFRFANANDAHNFAENLQDNGLFQKILPCALKWHLLDNGKGDLLRKHVAIPININMDIDKTVAIIKEAKYNLC